MFAWVYKREESARGLVSVGVSVCGCVCVCAYVDTVLPVACAGGKDTRGIKGRGIRADSLRGCRRSYTGDMTSFSIKAYHMKDTVLALGFFCERSRN